MDMLIHKITHLRHEGLNSAREFCGNVVEKDLVDKMKKDFELVKKPHSYSITSINDPTGKISTQIVSGKVMRKCCMDEVLAPVISLAT